MALLENPLAGAEDGLRDFTATRWSVVLRAGQSSSPEAHAALEELCRAYWQPLYAFVRRQGHGREEAQDLTQEFFYRLLHQDGLARVAPDKGRFRSFLLASLKNLMANEWHRARAQKRGGEAVHFSLDDLAGEAAYHAGLADALTPDKLFDRRWAETLLERVLVRVRDEWESRDPQQRFDDLKVFLVERRGTAPFAEVAARLGVTVSALRSTVHRLREAYREAFLQEIAHTVASPEELGDEIRYLLAALNDG